VEWALNGPAPFIFRWPLMPHSRPADAVIDARTLHNGDELRITIGPYRGFSYINVRRWYQPPDSKVWSPGKGVTLRTELIPWLRAALERAEQHALDARLLDEESYESCGLPLPDALTRSAA
jgi:hypothetical protein